MTRHLTVQRLSEILEMVQLRLDSGYVAHLEGELLHLKSDVIRKQERVIKLQEELITAKEGQYLN